MRERRLSQTLLALGGKKITVVIDETGDRKKAMRPRAAGRRKGTRIKTGKKTDYVARQYLGSIGKIDRGIVSVNAYGIYEQVTFPLLFKIFKPHRTLKPEDQ